MTPRKTGVEKYMMVRKLLQFMGFIWQLLTQPSQYRLLSEVFFDLPMKKYFSILNSHHYLTYSLQSQYLENFQYQIKGCFET